MRHDIEIYYHPEKPVPLTDLNMEVVDKDFSEKCTEQDREYIEDFWNTEIIPNNLQATSTPRGRANLIETSAELPAFRFEYVEYRQYLATSRTAKKNPRPLSQSIYDSMRVAAVGAALILPDDTVLVHRRPYNATHVAGVFDCSTAGVLPVDAQGVYIEMGLHEKIRRELGLNPDDLTIEEVTGVHSAGSPDFSGLITTVLRTPLNKEDIEKRMRSGVFPEVRYIPRKELADFVIDRYTADDMNHDGAMTLLSSLEIGEWYDAIEILQNRGKKIVEGTLYRECHFMPNDFCNGEY